MTNWPELGSTGHGSTLLLKMLSGSRDAGGVPLPPVVPAGLGPAGLGPAGLGPLTVVGGAVATVG